MNYFQAKRAERTFREYKRLAEEYWHLKPVSPEYTRLRSSICQMQPEIASLSRDLNVTVIFRTFPPPAIGGPVKEYNALAVVHNPDLAEGFSKQQILDVIDNGIGAAESSKNRARKHLVNPLCWVVDVPAFLIRLPFLVLRKAGLPASIEENIVAHIVKVLMNVLLVLLISLMVARWGLDLTLSDLLKIVAP